LKVRLAIFSASSRSMKTGAPRRIASICRHANFLKIIRAQELRHRPADDDTVAA